MRVWIVIPVVLGLAALGLVLTPHAIDWDAYRSDIEASATRLSGHDVSIRGPIELSIFPSVVLTAKDMTVTSGEGAPIGFELMANQADVTLEVGPLLAGRPVIRDLRLKRPVLAIDGDSSQKLRAWPPRWQDWAAPFLNLDLKQIGLSDGRIEMADGQPLQDLDVHDLSLDLTINGPDGPVEAAGLFKTEHHRFTMTADFARPDGDGMSAARVTIEAQNGIEETTSLRFSGRIKPIGEKQSLRGRLTLNGPDLQHGLAALSSATGYPSTFRFIDEAQAFAIEGQLEADTGGVRARDLQLRVNDKLSKGEVDLQLHPTEQLDLMLDLPPLRLADDTGLSDFLPLDLLSKLQVPPGDIDIRLREVAYREDKAQKIGVKLKTGQDRVTKVEEAKVQLPGLIDLRFEGGLFAGEIGPRLRGQLKAVGDNLKSSLSWLGLIEADHPARGWRSFSLEGDVDVTSVEMALGTFDMRLDSSRIKGEAGLRFSERQRLSLDVDIDRPNLDLYWSEGDAERLAAGLKERLKSLDTDIDLGFSKLIWRGTFIEEGSVRAGSESGRLNLAEMAAKTVGDTTISLKGSIDLEEDRADLDARFESQRPARALNLFKIDLPLTSNRLRPLQLDGSIEGTVERFDFLLETAYDEGNATFEGQAGLADQKPWYNLTATARHPNHQALAAQFGLAPLVTDGDAEGPLELSGRLRFQPDEPWTASGSILLGPTTFTGSLAYQDGPLSGPFDAKLSIGSPQKDSIAPLLILTGLRLAGDWTPARWLGRLPSTGLRTAWLEELEGTLSLASKGGLVGDGLKLNARLKDGLLYIEEIEARPWQGTLRGEVTLERRRGQPSLAIAIDLDQIEASDLAAWLGVKSGISGPLDLRLEASSAGLGPYDLVAGTTGRIDINLGPGELRGLGIPDLRQALRPDPDDQAAFSRTLIAPFTDITMTADINRGILTVEDGRLLQDQATSEPVGARIDGTVDFLLWIADLSLSPVREEEASANPSVYRLVGRPDRPDGYIATEN